MTVAVRLAKQDFPALFGVGAAAAGLSVLWLVPLAAIPSGPLVRTYHLLSAEDQDAVLHILRQRHLSRNETNLVVMTLCSSLADPGENAVEELALLGDLEFVATGIAVTESTHNDWKRMKFSSASMARSAISQIASDHVASVAADLSQSDNDILVLYGAGVGVLAGGNDEFLDAMFTHLDGHDSYRRGIARDALAAFPHTLERLLERSVDRQQSRETRVAAVEAILLMKQVYRDRVELPGDALNELMADEDIGERVRRSVQQGAP